MIKSPSRFYIVQAARLIKVQTHPVATPNIYNMKNARSIIAGTLAAATAAVAQNATITGAPSTMKTATPSSNSNIITTSILWAAGNVDDIINALPDPTALPTDDLSLKGSIVTVVPDGTVVSIAVRILPRIW